MSASSGVWHFVIQMKSYNVYKVLAEINHNQCLIVNNNYLTKLTYSIKNSFNIVLSKLVYD